MNDQITSRSVKAVKAPKQKSIINLYLMASILSILLIPIIIGLGVFRLYRNHIIHHVIKDSQKIGNAMITKYFSSFFDSTQQTSAISFSQPVLDKLDGEIRDEIQKYYMLSSIVKIKVYSNEMRILYSNERKIIGRIDRGNPSLKTAFQGEYNWKTSKKGEILDFNDELKFNIDVVSTYIPVKRFDNMVGVIELYFDITGDQNELKKAVFYSSGTAFGLLFIIFGIMFLLIKRSHSAQIKAYQDAQQAHLQRLLDDEIHHHSTNTAIGELAASIAHQVNNPITVALTRLGYIQKKTQVFSQFGELEADFMTIKTQMENVANLIKIMLRGAHHYAFTPEWIRLSQLIERIEPLLELRIKNHPIQVKTEIEPIDLGLKADRILLEQILINVLNNAVDAIIEKGGQGVIIVKAFDRSLQEKIIEIKDNGIGIAQADIDRIFRSFYSMKKNVKGTGLGLAITKRFMDMHQGDIVVKSTPDVGSTFQLIFPSNPEGNEIFEDE